MVLSLNSSDNVGSTHAKAAGRKVTLIVNRGAETAHRALHYMG
jgi:hypothetical protein